MKIPTLQWAQSTFGDDPEWFAEIPEPWLVQVKRRYIVGGWYYTLRLNGVELLPHELRLYGSVWQPLSTAEEAKVEAQHAFERWWGICTQAVGLTTNATGSGQGSNILGEK